MIGKQTLKSIFSIDGFIQKPEGEFLYTLTKSITTKGVIVELGSFKGRSTICLGLGARKKKQRVYAVDTYTGDASTGFQNTLPEFKKNIEQFQLKKTVTVKKGTTTMVAKQWKKPISLLFIDALHTYTAVKNDFKNWEQFVLIGGVIAFHDTLLPNPPRRVFEKYVLTNNQYDIIGYQESTIAVKKVSCLGTVGMFKKFIHYNLRDIRHFLYETLWPVRKTASLIGLYHEKER